MVGVDLAPAVYERLRMGGIVEGHVKRSLVARRKISRTIHGVHEGWQLEASMGSRRGARL